MSSDGEYTESDNSEEAEAKRIAQEEQEIRQHQEMMARREGGDA